ncbi:MULTISPECIES: hypothetical protein [unclassified Marinobacter]|uniref:hypothetical protein n=1 Tax=unclassified Marinobacter TaxID=83889 RepID=UPI001E35EE88|nr:MULTISPECIES: hypothetical protein [unclassified Marinobacter]
MVLQSLIIRMEEMVAGPYCVEHDQSKNLLTYNDLLQRYINHEQSIECRQRWKLGQSPVYNLINTMESNGIVVTRGSSGFAKMDGVSR